MGYSWSRRSAQFETMNSGISFGELEQAQPEPGLRPDQDRHFVVATIGEIRDGDLPIFVDLDVIREMEAHAQTNTRVELGGVMLGQQLVDDEGNPFVVISDSLRARHYEATKGSFKFTHDTWSQITRERNEFRSDLEMVGWYHTHPGWGVFLSGMDLFICNNFFNRPLDVALVIDPCAGQRGWFQWDRQHSRKTRETSGFMLTTNRFRQNELNYFLRLFSDDRQSVADPRYSQPSFSQSGFPEAEQEMVHITDNRRPIIDLAIIAMLFLQFLVAGLIAWRMTLPQGVADNETTARLTAIETQLQDRNSTERRSSREQAYSEILESIVSRETSQIGLVEKYARLAEENQSLNQNLEGQLSRAQLAILQRNELEEKLNSEVNRSTDLGRQLSSAKEIIQETDEKYQSLKLQLSSNPEAAMTGDEAGMFGNLGWLVYTGCGMLLTLLGAFFGYLYAVNGRRDLGQDDPDTSPDGAMKMDISSEDSASRDAVSQQDETRLSASDQDQGENESTKTPQGKRLSIGD